MQLLGAWALCALKHQSFQTEESEFISLIFLLGQLSCACDGSVCSSHMSLSVRCVSPSLSTLFCLFQKKHFFEWTKLCLLQARLQLQLQCLHYRALQLLLAGCCSCSNSQHSRTLKCELNCTATAPASSWILVHQPCDLFVSFWCWQARKHSHHKE